MPAYSPSSATAVYSGSTAIVWNAEIPVAGTASQQLSLNPPQGKDLQASVELSFAADPGAFSIDIQDADTDTAGSYVTKGTVNGGLNSNFTTRAEIGFPFCAKFMRLLLNSRTNSVALTAKVSVG